MRASYWKAHRLPEEEVRLQTRPAEVKAGKLDNRAELCQESIIKSNFYFYSDRGRSRPSARVSRQGEKKQTNKEKQTALWEPLGCNLLESWAGMQMQVFARCSLKRSCLPAFLLSFIFIQKCKSSYCMSIRQTQSTTTTTTTTLTSTHEKKTFTDA